MTSLTAQEIIEKAKECYELDLITETTLERITQKAETVPGYNAILDLPPDWEIKHERDLRRRARRRWWRR
jgi:hypothetical protein